MFTYDKDGRVLQVGLIRWLDLDSDEAKRVIAEHAVKQKSA